jgi:hypothetical protein
MAATMAMAQVIQLRCTRQLNKRYRSRLIVLRGKPEEQTMGMARFFQKNFGYNGYIYIFRC